MEMRIDIPYEHIRSIREELGLNQDQVAKFLNIAQNTYSQYETGKIEWTASTLIALADFYKVSVDYLLDRTNIQTPYPKKG